MGNNDSRILQNQTTITRKKQRDAGEKLREIAQLAREEHMTLNKTKLGFNAVGAAGGVMTLAGILAAPFTGGLSFGLAAVGALTGIAGGAGDIATSYIESQVLRERIKETQTVLDQVLEESVLLVQNINRKLSGKKSVIDFEKILKNDIKISCKETYSRKVTRAVEVINITLEAIPISKGIPCQEFNICDIQDLIKLNGPSADKVRQGVTVARAVRAAKVAGTAAKTTGKVLKATGGAALAGLGLALDIKSIIDNSIKIAKNDSEVADLIEKIADHLTKTKLSV